MEAQLRREGVVISRKTVQRHMREMGRVAIYPGPNLSRRQHKEHVFPYLLRNLTLNAPNQVWGIDITSIRLLKGWMYLVAVLDWYSRYMGSPGARSHARNAVCSDYRSTCTFDGHSSDLE